MNEGDERYLRFRQRFIAGLVTIAPLFVTVWVVVAATNFMAGWLARFLSRLFEPVPYFFLLLLSVLIMAGVIYAVGWLTTTYFGRVIVGFLDWFFMGIPVLQYVYKVSKDTVNALQNLRQKVAFKKVVWVNMGGGKMMLGMVVDELEDKYLVFIPSTPNPTTGFILLLDKDTTVEAGISTEEALKLLISGGLVNVFQEKRST